MVLLTHTEHAHCSVSPGTLQVLLVVVPLYPLAGYVAYENGFRLSWKKTRLPIVLAYTTAIIVGSLMVHHAVPQ